MPVITVPTDSMAAIAARAGQAALQRLANAVMTVSGTDVAGHLSRESAALSTGGLGVQSRLVVFRCLTVDLPAGALVGASALYGVELFRIAERDDQRELGTTVLTLERD